MKRQLIGASCAQGDEIDGEWMPAALFVSTSKFAPEIGICETQDWRPFRAAPVPMPAPRVLEML
jgi:hypothetical protein